MAYRLRPSKPFTTQFRGVAENQLRKAIGYLEDRPEGPHEAVHDARKRFKRVRALYRLVQPDAPDFRARENARIREIAGTLSAVRDATALVETVHYLLDFASSPEEEEALRTAMDILAGRRDRIAAEEHDLPAKMQTAADACRTALSAIAALDLSDAPHKSAKRLGKAWRKQLGKAHRALRACDEHGSAESYHELRKSGQTYWMHLSLLRDVWPSAMRAKQAECKTLVDLLGHEHDLSVLTELVNEEPDLFGDGEALARLLGSIISRQQILRGEAIDRAHDVFAEDPDTEGELIEMLWEKAAGSDARSHKHRRGCDKAEKETALHG